MKLTVLADNSTFIDMYYLGEPAVSYYIEDGGKRILFDAGYSDVFLRNAMKMGIDIEAVDTVVLSHGHNDHSGGLVHLDKNRYKLVAHPDAFIRRKDDDLDIGSPYDIDEIKSFFSVDLSTGPVKISEHLTYLGQIERKLPFEPSYAIGTAMKDGKEVPDQIFDDSALAYDDGESLFIITGCSHSGICNIIEQAVRITGRERIKGVIGGFHLFEDDEKLQRTIAYLEEKEIKLLYPCHCVSLKAKIAMAKRLPVREVGVGLELTI